MPLAGARTNTNGAGNRSRPARAIAISTQSGRESTQLAVTDDFSVGVKKPPKEASRKDTLCALRIMLADDHPVVREGLAAIIGRQGDMMVVAQADNGLDAVKQFSLHSPDMGLIDLRMPLMDGVSAVSAICQKKPGARLAVLTSQESEEEIYRTLKAGARGFAAKESSASELIECIRAIGEGRMWIPAGIGTMLAKRMATRELTPRELEVLRRLAAGESNKEIGAALEITEGTVKVHVTHILEKLSAAGRTEAISLAMQRGLVRVDLAR